MILHVEVWIIMMNDDDNVIMMMITWHHSMMIVHDDDNNHDMSDVKACIMAWYGMGMAQNVAKMAFSGVKNEQKRGWRGGWQNYTEKSVS